jgi:beta-glucosidase
MTGVFSAPESARYDLSLSSIGRSRLSIDGKEILNVWDKPGDGTKTTAIELTAGRTYQLQIDYASEPGTRWRNLRVGCMPQIPADSIEQAAELAGRSDVAIVFAGLTNEWESEAFDRPDMELPGDQVKLIERVSEANPNTIVVINAGSPITMDWLDRVAAVAQAWYLGQETGNALAAVLFGDANPSGKLPTTFPKRLRDNPAFINYPGENGRVRYGEGLYVGYRYYDKKDIAPQFPFGFGLSYTTFEYSNLTLSAREYATREEIRFSVDVRNTGTRAGKEIVQVYVRQVKPRLTRPDKELKAFTKIALATGGTQTVKFVLDWQALSYYDPALERWVADPGEYELLVGSSSRDIRQTAKFNLSGKE